METFLTTVLRKYIIQLNIVFHGNKITFYVTENNNYLFTVNDRDVNMKVGINILSLSSNFFVLLTLNC
jgi:hypothetical protein